MSGSPAAVAAGSVPMREALRVWARVAAQSFGGPAGQIAVIHRITVEEKRWLDEVVFLRALGFCMFLPGPEAQQLATYIGWKLNGIRGGLLAGGLFILPGFLSIYALSVVYALHGGTPALEAVFFGLKPAVLAVVLQAVLRLRARALRDRFSVLLAAGAFLAMFVFDVPFPLVVIAAAAAGAWRARAGAPERSDAAESFIDRGARRRALLAAFMFLALWILPVAVLMMRLGVDHVLAEEAQFFSKAAVVTFGGAYAVLSYVAQQAVEVHGWLGPTEMLDGLGLAETTPGPLIQVVQFVGFMGAWRDPGAHDPLLMATLGSVITTWVTFAPCFLFIFAGAPFVEGLERRTRLHAGLAGITAAVVGVVLNLALWFAMHTLFGDVREVVAGPTRLEAPVWSTLDWRAALVALVALVLAMRLQAGMFVVLGAGVLLGVVTSWPW